MGVLGERTNISSFYISFVLAPLASNASELIAAFNYSLKKTSRTIVISFAALQVNQKRLFAWAWNRTAQSIACAIKPLCGKTAVGVGTNQLPQIMFLRCFLRRRVLHA